MNVNKSVTMAIAVCIALSGSVFGKLSITPTGVGFNASENALYPKYSVSGTADGVEGALWLRVAVYSSDKSRIYPSVYVTPDGETWESEYTLNRMNSSSSSMLSKGKHSFQFLLDQYGLNSDDVEDGKPAIIVELAAVDDNGTVFAIADLPVPWNENSGSVSTTANALYGRAKTVQGVCYDEDENIYGPVTVKFGKINKKRQVKVSMTVSPFVGKKQTVSGTFTADNEGVLFGSLKFKSPLGIVDFTAYRGDSGDLEFYSESANGYFCESCSVGGKFRVSQLAFYVDEADIDFGGGYEQILGFPDGEPIYVKNGTKFSFNKVPKISYKRFREDGDTRYDLTGLDDAKKTNYSALKLTYAEKTGIFKGSFKIYTSNEESVAEGKSPKLKTYTANVSGIVIDGFGTGSATVKVGKKTYILPVFIEGENDD